LDYNVAKILSNGKHELVHIQLASVNFKEKIKHYP